MGCDEYKCSEVGFVLTKVDKYMQGRILSLSWPVVMEGLAAMLLNILITAMVGSLGAVALAGVGLANVIQISLFMTLAGAGVGASALVARETGAGDWQEVTRIIGQALLAGVAVSLGLTLAGLTLAKSLLSLIGAAPEVSRLAGDLVRILFLFTPFQLIMSIGNGALRGMGKTRLTFYNTIAVNSLAALAAAVLIFGWGPPAMGPYGASLGVGISYLAGALLVLTVLSRRENGGLRWRHIAAFRPDTVRRILDISWPTLLEQAALQGGRLAFTFMLAGVGTAQFAAHQIAVQVESISFMPGFGFSVAAMTLVGQNLGKGMARRADQYARLTCKIAFWGMTAMGCFIFIFARPLTSLFINDPEVIYWGALCVMISVLEQPTIGLNFVLGGALRGAGDTRWPMYVTTTGVWLCRLPLVYLFITVWGFPVTAAWYITACDFLVRSAILWRRFSSGKWRTVLLN